MLANKVVRDTEFVSVSQMRSNEPTSASQCSSISFLLSDNTSESVHACMCICIYIYIYAYIYIYREREREK